MLYYYFKTLPSHQSAGFWLLVVWGFFLCIYLLEGERNVRVIWSCLQKQSNWGNWYMILCSSDYSVKIWTLLGGKTT